MNQRIIIRLTLAFLSLGIFSSQSILGQANFISVPAYSPNHPLSRVNSMVVLPNGDILLAGENNWTKMNDSGVPQNSGSFSGEGYTDIRHIFPTPDGQYLLTGIWFPSGTEQRRLLFIILNQDGDSIAGKQFFDAAQPYTLVDAAPYGSDSLLVLAEAQEQGIYNAYLGVFDWQGNIGPGGMRKVQTGPQSQHLTMHQQQAIILGRHEGQQTLLFHNLGNQSTQNHAFNLGNAAFGKAIWHNNQLLISGMQDNDAAVFLVSGDGQLLDTWTYHLDMDDSATGISLSPSGGFLIWGMTGIDIDINPFSGNNKSFLMHLSANGNQDWVRYYGNEQTSFINQVQVMGNALYFAGTTGHPVSSSPRPFVVRADLNAATGLTPDLPTENTQAPPFAVGFRQQVETMALFGDRHLLMGGYVQSATSARKTGWFGMATLQGDTLWSKLLDKDYSSGFNAPYQDLDQEIIKVLPLGEDGFALLGKGTAFIETGFLIGMDTLGQELWSVSLGIGLVNIINDAIVTHDGHFLVCGAVSTGLGDFNALLTLVSPNGQKIWEKELDGAAFENPKSIVEDAAGNFWLAGVNQVPFDQVSDVYLTKIDRQGNVIDQHFHHFGFGDNIRTVAMDPKGNLYLAGHVMLADGQQDLLLLSTDSLGQVRWSHQENLSENESFHKLEVFGDSLLIVGETGIPSFGELNRYGFAGLYTTQGNPVWHKYYGEKARMAQMGGLVIVGNQAIVGGSVTDSNWQQQPFLHAINLRNNDVVTGLPPQPSLDEDLVLYPNPGREETFIDWPKMDRVKAIRVFQLNGKELKIPIEQATATTRLDFSKAQPGIYLIRLQLEGKTFHRKFVKL